MTAHGAHSNGSSSDRARLVEALHTAWSVESAKVQEFGLRAVEEQIRPAASGWAVPVASGVSTGSAYELARVLDRLQELVEEKSKLSISLFLDPFAKAS